MTKKDSEMSNFYSECVLCKRYSVTDEGFCIYCDWIQATFDKVAIELGIAENKK